MEMNDTDAVGVRSVMGEPPIVVDALATVEQAIKLMRQHHVSSLVVDKQHEGDQFGLLVVTDIAKKVIGANQSPENTRCYEIMSKPAVTVDVDINVKYAVRLIDRFGVSRAIVMERGNLVGMVTRRSMVLEFLALNRE